MLGAAVEKAAEHPDEFRLVQQEGVVPLVALDLDEADIRRDRVQRVDDVAAFRSRKQPIAAEGDDAESRPAALEGRGQMAAMPRREATGRAAGWERGCQYV